MSKRSGSLVIVAACLTSLAAFRDPGGAPLRGGHQDGLSPAQRLDGLASR